jgi:hypothetical protein
LDAISAYGDEEQQEQLKLAQSMKPGELYIIHLAKNPSAGSAIVAIESQVPLFEE